MVTKIAIYGTRYAGNGAQVTHYHHFLIQRDGLVITCKRVIDSDDCIYVAFITGDGTLSDPQCQGLVSLGLACCVTYKLLPKDIKCEGTTWEELLRRG